MKNMCSLDQVFLALTCKRMLAISSLITIKIPSAAKHRLYGQNCSAMLAILQLLKPRGPRGRPLRSVALCCVCYRFMPKRKNYWDRLKEKHKGEYSGGVFRGYDHMVDKWCHKWSSSYECPGCWCEDQIRKYGHSAIKASSDC